MAQATISQFRHLIRTLNYVVSTHAAEELDDDQFSSSTLKISSSRAKSRRASATLKRAKSSASSLAPRSTDRVPKLSSKSATEDGSSSSRSMSVEHHCAHCGSAVVQLKHVTRSFGRGGALLVIESIPMWSCPSCGESYFSAQTLHEIERIKALRKSVAIPRAVPVAAFEAVDA
jgi:YgiT-type zinc finger domain-containing protein